MSIFVDILEQRRSHSHLLWILRQLHPISTNCQKNSHVSPMLFRFKVLVNEDVKKFMKEIYPDESSSQHFLRINEMITEMGCLKNTTIVRFLGFILIKIMNRILQSLLINEAELLQIRSRMGSNPVVFMPTHRSYADFILMAFLCFNYDIEVPVVVAGMDFHAMFGMATVLRQCGAMYIRRSFKDDKVYAYVLKKYIQTVISEGNSPFEFFIEGTRSRCGKSLMPKLGILKTIVESYIQGEVSDITFIPISINYDRILEDNLFAREVLGIPKPKESTSGLLKGISLLEQQYGNIYVSVGDELSLKSFLKENRCSDSLLRLAQLIVHKQQLNTVISYFNMISLVLLSNLMNTRKKSIPISILTAGVAKIREFLKTHDINLDDEHDLERSLAIHKFISKNDQDQTLHLSEITSSTINDTQTVATSFILLQHYSNPCYHSIVSPALILLLLKNFNTFHEDDIFLMYKKLRNILKYDFLFFNFSEQQDFDDSIHKLIELNIIRRDGKVLRQFENSTLNDIFSGMMLPYFRGYTFICRYLSSIPSVSLKHRELTNQIRNKIEFEVKKSNDTSLLYSLSSHFSSCALSSLQDMGALLSDRFGTIRIRDVARLRDIISFLDHFLSAEMKSQFEKCTSKL